MRRVSQFLDLRGVWVGLPVDSSLLKVSPTTFWDTAFWEGIPRSFQRAARNGHFAFWKDAGFLPKTADSAPWAMPPTQQLPKAVKGGGCILRSCSQCLGLDDRSVILGPWHSSLAPDGNLRNFTERKWKNFGKELLAHPWGP